MSQAPFDTLWCGGTIRTLDPRRPCVEAIGAAGGCVVALGERKTLLAGCGPRTKHVDLGGGTLIPGFHDAHVHVWKVGQLLTRIADLRTVRSLAELRRMLLDRAATTPAADWVLGRGFNELRLAERSMPTRDDLDAWLPERPVWITRTCGHVAVANSRALAAAGLSEDAAAPAGGELRRHADGRLNGIVTESALPLVQRAIPAPQPTDYAEMIRAAQRHQLSRGITSATDPGVEAPLLQVYRDLAAEGRLVCRYDVMTLAAEDPTDACDDDPPGTLSDRLRVDTVKFFLDGGLSGATAALSVPYRHASTQGVLRWTLEDFVTQARRYQERGWRIAAHAIGDRAIELGLCAFRQLRTGDSGVRHRLEHFGLPTAEHCRVAAALDLFVVTQPAFLYELGANFQAYLPEGFPIVPYPFRSMLSSGIDVAFSSDAPVVDDNPLRGIQAAVLRRTAEGEVVGSHESIEAEVALQAYTRGGALVSGDEARRGTLAVGKWADCALLSGDPVETSPAELTNLGVWGVWIAGQEVFS